MSELSLLQLMFCESQSELSESLNEITCELSDLQCWDELTESQRADLFGKLIGTRLSIEHCLRVNFKCDPGRLPSRLDEVPGADGLSPWSLPSSRAPIVNGRFLDCVSNLMKRDGQ